MDMKGTTPKLFAFPEGNTNVTNRYELKTKEKVQAEWLQLKQKNRISKRLLSKQRLVHRGEYHHKEEILAEITQNRTNPS
jgi:hypothetical protein